MGAWPGKYIIGLTGNIATGKSVVRKMLEHLGAYGIDADALGHRAIALGAPGYQPVIDTFGKWILGADEQIDRTHLARLVFGDPQALSRLEAIVHPLVRQAVDVLVRRSTQSVIVIEAIKLLESPLRANCDTLCVTYAPREVQLARLMQKRGMSEEAARQRIAAQPPQEEKIAAANVVIRNDGSFEDTWRQVNAFWQELFPSVETAPAAVAEVRKGEMRVDRARPQEASEIAAFITRMSGGSRPLSRADIMASFGEKAFLLLKMDGKIAGLVGWQVENLVARTDDVYIETSLPVAEAMSKIMEEVERSSHDLQCEALLLFLPPNLAKPEEMWRKLGYEPRTMQSLGVRAWQEAAQESMPTGTVMLFKQLRKDRVLRPV
ncbi:MAG: dephospho-CoA kinase [Chloroflexota bacterium]|nr:MAG: dephospho-CoA kinase [Chloroflexota bacterium]